MIRCRSTIPDNKISKNRKADIIPWMKDVDKYRRCQPKGPPLPPSCNHSHSKFECSSLGVSEMESFHRKFYYTRKKSQQDAFILRYCLGRSPKRKSSVAQKERNLIVEYYVPTRERNIQVCKEAFIGILRVNKYRVNALLKSFYKVDISKNNTQDEQSSSKLKKKGNRRKNRGRRSGPATSSKSLANVEHDTQRDSSFQYRCQSACEDHEGIISSSISLREDDVREGKQINHPNENDSVNDENHFDWLNLESRARRNRTFNWSPLKQVIIYSSNTVVDVKVSDTSQRKNIATSLHSIICQSNNKTNICDKNSICEEVTGEPSQQVIPSQILDSSEKQNVLALSHPILGHSKSNIEEVASESSPQTNSNNVLDSSPKQNVSPSSLSVLCHTNNTVNANTTNNKNNTIQVVGDSVKKTPNQKLDYSPKQNVSAITHPILCHSSNNTNIYEEVPGMSSQRTIPDNILDPAKKTNVSKLSHPIRCHSSNNDNICEEVAGISSQQTIPNQILDSSQQRNVSELSHKSLCVLSNINSYDNTCEEVADKILDSSHTQNDSTLSFPATCYTTNNTNICVVESSQKTISNQIVGPTQKPNVSTLSHPIQCNPTNNNTCKEVAGISFQKTNPNQILDSSKKQNVPALSFPDLSHTTNNTNTCDRNISEEAVGESSQKTIHYRILGSFQKKNVSTLSQPIQSSSSFNNIGVLAAVEPSQQTIPNAMVSLHPLSHVYESKKRRMRKFQITHGKENIQETRIKKNNDIHHPKQGQMTKSIISNKKLEKTSFQKNKVNKVVQKTRFPLRTLC
ncbi:putative mediator of RNA polymerase II transcription subunit 26 [Halyomorpha halys]|uniref:putative mediator of RNA polymerase II transcription subunit 26 n=1 Tax=Halyomorpha halys TaxID=286706 RepID=UPI0006D51549|nr:putative uncharacterized protein DDB_G0282133 [Halyomorpha halys]